MHQLKGLSSKLFESLTSKLPVVGVEMGTSSLKVAIGKRNDGGFEVEDFLVEDLSHAEDDAKFSLAKQKLTGYLKQKNIAAALAYLVVEDQDFFSTRISLPSVTSKKELKQAVELEAKDTLPFPENEAVSDYHVINEIQKADGSKSLELLYIALHRQQVDKAISLLDGLNLSLENVNIVPGSLLNVLSRAVGLDEKELIAVLELGYNHTSISIFKEKKLIFTRRLSIGSSDITNSMLGVFSTNKGVVRLSYEDAEKIKQAYGILLEEQNIKIQNLEIDSARVNSMMRPVLERMIAEIRNSFDYLYEKGSEGSITRVYLTGGGARLKNIDKFLNQELGVPVEFLSLESSTTFSMNVTEDKKAQLPNLVSTIGAMLQVERGLDFLPHEYHTKKREAIEWIAFRLSAITIASLLLVSYLYLSFEQMHFNKRSKAVRLNESTLQSLMQVKQEIDTMQGIISAIKGGNIDGSILLRELSIATHPAIMLENISYSGAQGGGSIKLTGLVYGSENDASPILVNYIKALEDSFLFENAILNSSVQAGTEKDPVLNFSISCKVQVQPGT